MDWREFERLAQTTMSSNMGTRLTKKTPTGSPKEFDMVSDDGDMVGDAKFLTLVHRTRMPPAKFMEIAGHVWLLQRDPRTEAVLSIRQPTPCSGMVVREVRELG